MNAQGRYVCDGSVFATGSGYNPTLTIIAVALRIAPGWQPQSRRRQGQDTGGVGQTLAAGAFFAWKRWAALLSVRIVPPKTAQ